MVLVNSGAALHKVRWQGNAGLEVAVEVDKEQSRCLDWLGASVREGVGMESAVVRCCHCRLHHLHEQRVPRIVRTARPEESADVHIRTEAVPTSCLKSQADQYGG